MEAMSHLLSDYDHEDRPWGSFDRFTLNELSTVKILRLKPGQRLSLQKHEHREEFWHIITGSGTLELDGVSRAVKKGDESLTRVGSTHRAEAGPDGLEILEIAFGEFNESDIIRLEDDFHRA